MCDPVSIMIAGTVMQAGAQHQAARRGRRELSRVEDRNDTYNQRILGLTKESEQQYNPVTRQEAQQQAQDQAQSSLLNELQKGSGTYATTTQGNTGNVYNIEKAKRVAADAEKASTMAAMIAKLRAPGELRLREGYADANNAGRMGRIATEQAAMARAGGIDVNNASQPNPGLMLAGGLMSGYGMGSLGAAKTDGPSPVAYSEYGPVYHGSAGPYIPKHLFRS